jgi:hypothetical protein
MNKKRGLALAFGIYAVAAVILLYHRNLFDGTHFLGDGGPDPSLYIWMFHFMPAAIAHLQNPFILKAAWVPAGLNITQATTTPLLALLAWPITAFGGPVIAYNVVSLTTPALAATACFAFARVYAKTWVTAFVAGWVFGFSTSVFAPLMGHLQTSFIAFLPLAFLAVAQRAAGKFTSLQFFLSLSLVLIAQFLVSLENFVIEAIFLFSFALVTEASQPEGIARLKRLRIDNLIVGLIAVYTAVGVVMSPFIYNFFRDYAQMPHKLQNGGYYGTDLLNFVIPTPVTWLGGDLALPVAQQYTGNWSEDLGYIGAPLLLLTIFAAWRLRHEKRVWPLLAVLGFGFVFTLGPRLHFLGHITFPLPWAAMERLPFMANALPARFMPFVLLAISGILAFWIDRAEGQRRIALGALAVSAVFVLPATFVRPNFWNAPVPKAQMFSSGAYKEFIHPGDTVLFLPFYFANGDAMLWQAETHGYFRMTNGYGNFVPKVLDDWPAAKMLEAGVPGSDFAQQFDLFARANGIDKVIVPASILPVWSKALQSGGWSSQTVGDLTVFTESAQVRNATPIVTSTEPKYTFDAAHFAALRAAAACMLAKDASHLDIASAVAGKCLGSDVMPMPGDPHGNWDKTGGWLGFYENGVGVGVTTDAITANRIVAATAAGAETVYFPYPQRFHPGSAPGQPGQLLVVFPRQTITGSK